MNNPTDNPLHAGIGKCDITTDDPTVAVHDRLYAKALVLDDGNTRLVIVALDAVAIGGICDVKDDFLPKLRAKVEAELSIPGCNVMVHATHTHPPGRLLCDDQQQVLRTFDAIRQAADNLTPVRVGVGRGREDRISINRTMRMKDGNHWTIRQTNPCPPDDEVESLGPHDPEIGIMRIDRVDGKPLAVIYNFACHPLVGVPSSAVTANYPGFASKVIEDTLGNDAMALFLQGAAGDVTEVVYKDVHHPRHAESIGTALGLSTLKALTPIQTSPGRLQIATQTIALPRRTDSDERIAALQRDQAELLASLRFTNLNFKSFLPLYLKHLMDGEHPGNYSYAYMHAAEIGCDDLVLSDGHNQRSIEKYLRNIETMEKLARIEDKIATLKRHQAINDASGESTVEAQVQAMRIGDCVLLAAPLEVMTETALRVKATSPHAFTFVAAFSNGYLHYGPPPAYYDAGGYEATECMLAPQWEAIFEKAVAEVLGKV